MPLNDKKCPSCGHEAEYFYLSSESDKIECKNEECEYVGPMDTIFASGQAPGLNYQATGKDAYRKVGQEFRQMMGAIKKGAGAAAGQFSVAD